ncbi:MAG: tetratricopeptide repeat protein [Hyphomicrobiaceae bacterium]
MADDTGSASPPPSDSPPSGRGPDTSVSGGGGSFVALKSGLTIRHYVIEEVIGAGGFGITYRSRHARLTSKVFALKEFFPRQFAARQGTHVISTPDGDGLFRWGLDRFLKEAEALAKCEHPGIVDVVDYFEENGTAYAVLGFVEGQQMGQWLEALGRPPTQAEIDRVLMPLLDALDAVHSARLLHRDIAPDNILIRRDGSPCLIDFGACREDIRDRSQKLSAIVKHGYSPPEQYHGIAELQGPWTDIYAVAATVYRAISGQPPMDSSRRGALGDGLQPLSAMPSAPGYRPGFLAAIDQGLKLKPDERPRSIVDWRPMLLSESPPSASAARQSTARSPATQHDGTIHAQAEASADGSNGVGATSRKPEPVGNAAPAVVSNVRRGPLLAVVAMLALVTAGGVAWWRRPEPNPGNINNPPVVVERPSLPSQPKQSPEAIAEAAWRPISETNDPALVERFLAEHGSTPSAAAARTRLAALRQDARNKEAEKAAADRARAEAEASRRQTRDDNWRTCREAADTNKESACAPVIQSDDTTLRRAQALHLVGTAARKAGNYDKAIAEYTRSLALIPDDAQVLTDRGIAHFLKGGPEARRAAMQDYSRAIGTDPSHAEALNNRAWSLFQEGRTTEALADANKSIEVAPTNGYAYDTRGQILEALGRKEDAIRDFEQALRIDPTQETSRSGLARLKAGGR